MLDKMLLVATGVAIDAGKLARKGFGHTSFQYKSDEQLVTPFDQQCQKLIVETISHHWPDHGFLAEESPDPELPILKIPPTDNDQTWWVIDPIDGTRNYAHGVPLFAVSIGVLRHGWPILGVIYDPMREEIFTAVRGTPPLRNGKPMSCRNDPLHRNSQIAVAGHYSYGPPKILDPLIRHHVCVNLGTAALHYAYVSAGAFSAGFGWDVRLWDIAAGSALALAAGAKVTQPNGEERFPFSCDHYQGDVAQVLMAGPAIHKQLLEMPSS